MLAHPGSHTLRRIEGVATSAALVVRLERAIRRFRLQSAHNLLDEVFAAHAPESIVKDIGRPLLQRLDDPAAARFATSLLELRLLAHARGWERVNGPTSVLACAPHDEDVLPLIALGIALAERGCCICYLAPPPRSTPWSRPSARRAPRWSS
jgi:hypothetical protein